MALDLTQMAASAVTKFVQTGGLMDVLFRKQGRYGHTPYLDLLRGSGYFKPADNQLNWTQTIATGRNTNFQYYGPYQTWKTDPLKGYARSMWGSKEGLISWSVCAQEIYYNGDGTTKIFDVMDRVKDNTVKSLMEELNARLLNKNSKLVTANPGGTPSQMFTDLESLIGDHESTVKVIGDISSVDAVWWRSLIKRPGDLLPVDGWGDQLNGDWDPLLYKGLDTNVVATGRYAGWQMLKLDDLSQMIECLGDHYDGSAYTCLTTKKIILEMEKLIRAEGLQINNNLQGILSGYNYTGVNWRGVDFVADKFVPEGTMYFLHPEAMGFKPIKGRWMAQRDEATPLNQDAMYGTIFVWGDQFVNDRHALGKFEKVATRV